MIVIRTLHLVLLGFFAAYTDVSAVPTMEPTSIRSCYSCSVGEYYSTLPVSETSVQGCTPCEKGYMCAGECAAPEACEKGYILDATGTNGPCVQCAVGEYTLMEGQSVCLQCPAGYACADQTTAPAICPAGSISSAGATSCDLCAAGTYSAAPGATSCSDCLAGYSCVEGATGKTMAKIVDLFN